MPGTIIGCLHVLTYLIFTTPLLDTHSYLYSIDKETGSL